MNVAPRTSWAAILAVLSGGFAVLCGLFTILGASDWFLVGIVVFSLLAISLQACASRWIKTSGGRLKGLSGAGCLLVMIPAAVLLGFVVLPLFM
jgi:hypothetical protein